MQAWSRIGRGWIMDHCARGRPTKAAPLSADKCQAEAAAGAIDGTTPSC